MPPTTATRRAASVYSEPVSDPWSHNSHYHPVVLDAVPDGCGEALDIGCGRGLLVGRLAPRCGRITGIDRDAAMVAAARERGADIGNAALIEADFLRHPFPDEAFDFVSAVASLHHMDLDAAVANAVRVLRPGGTLVVVGLARDASPVDWLLAVPAFFVHVYQRRLRHRSAVQRKGLVPVRDPDLTWGQTHRAFGRLLPDARYRRRLLWRYTLVWRKPA